MAGVSKDTLLKLMVDLGAACANHLAGAIRNIDCKRLQVDEIWAYVERKAKSVPQERRGEFGVGDVWTYVALDADTKLAVSFLVGKRDPGTARAFMLDVRSRIKSRPQLTTDGHAMYLDAAEEAFGGDVDYAMLVKLYGADREGESRYSPAVCKGARRARIQGSPDPKHVSTSYIERQNLTMRMSMRRFTRLTNAFSKKVENHIAAIAIYATHYNFVRIHQTTRVTPAMKAGLAAAPWKVEDLVALLPAVEHVGGRPRKTN
jgi:IS1 family transposase